MAFQRPTTSFPLTAPGANDAAQMIAFGNLEEMLSAKEGVNATCDANFITYVNDLVSGLQAAAAAASAMAALAIAAPVAAAPVAAAPVAEVCRAFCCKYQMAGRPCVRNDVERIHEFEIDQLFSPDQIAFLRPRAIADIEAAEARRPQPRQPRQDQDHQPHQPRQPRQPRQPHHPPPPAPRQDQDHQPRQPRHPPPPAPRPPRR